MNHLEILNNQFCINTLESKAVQYKLDMYMYIYIYVYVNT